MRRSSWAITLAAAAAERWLDLAERRELGKPLAEVRKGGVNKRDEGFELYLAWIQPEASPSSSESSPAFQWNLFGRHSFSAARPSADRSTTAHAVARLADEDRGRSCALYQVTRGGTGELLQIQ